MYCYNVCTLIIYLNMETTHRFKCAKNNDVYECKSLYSNDIVYEFINSVNKISIPYFLNKLVVIEKQGINIFDIANNNLIVGWKSDNFLHVCRNSHYIKYMLFDNIIIFFVPEYHKMDDCKNLKYNTSVKECNILHSLQTTFEYECCKTTTNNATCNTCNISHVTAVLFDIKNKIWKKINMNINETTSAFSSFAIFCRNICKYNDKILMQSFRHYEHHSKIITTEGCIILINQMGCVELELSDRVVCACNKNILVMYNEKEYYMYDHNKKNVICNLKGKFMGWHDDTSFMEHVDDSFEFKQIKQNSIKKIKNTNANECCICYEEIKIRHVLIPCGHTQYCEKCIEKLPNQTCSMCKLRYTQILKIFV